MRTKLMLWGTAAVLALGSTAAMASVVVVKSLGPSSKAYPPGKTLADSAKITLQGGDVVTLLGPGSAKTLRGPGNFDTRQVASASSSARRGRFGALRASEVAKNPSIWDIDVTQSGKVCVSKKTKLQVWRPTSEGEVTVQIRKPDGSVAPLTWASGTALTHGRLASPSSRAKPIRSTGPAPATRAAWSSSRSTRPSISSEPPRC